MILHAIKKGPFGLCDRRDNAAKKWKESTCGGDCTRSMVTSVEWCVVSVAMHICLCLLCRSVGLHVGLYAFLSICFHTHTQCRTGCDSNSYSPAPRVDTVQTTPGLLDFPMGVAVSPGGEFALISMFGSHSIVKMDLAAPSLTSILAGGSAGFADGRGNNAQFNSPLGMCITPDGSKALVAEYRNNRVRVVDTNTGDVTTLAGSDPGYEDSTVGTSAGFKVKRVL